MKISALYAGISALMLGALCGCSSMKPEDFANHEPALSLEKFFNGEVRGSGVFYDRFGSVKTSFVVTLHGVPSENGMTLEETLLYSNGERVDRTYHVRKISEHTYEASADGLVGNARIESYGNVLRWRYVLAQPIGSQVWHLRFDDWMMLQPTGVVLNRAKAYKWGIFLGEVFMSIERVSDSSKPPV